MVISAQPRNSVQVRFSNGQVYEAPVGTPLLAFVQRAEADSPPEPEARALAALVDNRLRELSFPVQHDIEIRAISLKDIDGHRIYRRSLSFLLVAAASACFPDYQVYIDHSLPQRAYFCHVEGRPNFSDAELQIIQNKMQEMVAANLSINRTRLSLDDAQSYFETRGDQQKLRLLRYRTRDYLRVYELGDFSDYFFGYMVPSTGYLQWFDLQPLKHGFLLRYPSEIEPTSMKPIKKLSRIDEVFQQTSEWLRLLNLRDIGQLNEANEQGRLRELVLVAEALQERRIADIASQAVQAREHGARIILIAGPSSSGKTTFSKRLAIQLMTHGIKPFTLEMDNYFVDRELTPRDDNGDYDFESLHALNISLLNEHLQQLISSQAVALPRFDFKVGKRIEGRSVQLTADHMIILEGIHGLNPDLMPTIDPAITYKIYVSALTQLNIDRYNRVSTTDVRLLRRIIRDAIYRGWTATDTLNMWDRVGRGERANIFPYQDNADIMFNSALMYELAMLRPLAEPHLLRVNLNHPKWAEANRLLSFLAWVMPADDTWIPDNSILREFIGGSNLRDFHPGL